VNASYGNQRLALAPVLMKPIKYLSIDLAITLTSVIRHSDFASIDAIKQVCGLRFVVASKQEGD